MPLVWGLGVTNTNQNDGILIPHGESSFFQVYLEAGVLGLMMRLVPFAIFLWYALKYRCGVSVGIYISAIFITITVAPVFGPMSAQALLGTILGCFVGQKIK